MSAMRVLALTKSTGGIAFYNRMLMRALHGAGLATHTVCLSEEAEAYAAALAADGLSAETVPMARYRIDPGGDLRALRRVLAAARREASDVIIGHGSKAGVLARAAGRRLGRPAIYCQASMPFLRRVQGRKAPLYWALEYLAGQLGGDVVTLTETARRRTLDHRLVPEARITTIRTGIDIRRFRPTGARDGVIRDLGLDPARPVVGWVGRLEPQKAPLDHLRAVRLVAARDPGAQFVIAGEGRLEAAVRTEAAALGLGDRLRLLPWQNDLPRLLQGFDVFVLSSLWEGLPLTLLEAMASGCAPVSTEVDGCLEAVEDGRSGLLVPAEAPDRLAEAILTLTAAPERRAEIAAAARARTEALFDEARMIAEWRALLTAAVARREAGAALPERAVRGAGGS